MVRAFLIGAIMMIVAACATSPETESTSSRQGARPHLEYDSSQLMMKNSDQMNDLIKKKMQIAENAQASSKSDDDSGITVEPEALEALTDAMRIALSRPDQDGTREALFTRLRRELLDLNSLETVLKTLTAESISALKSKNSPNVQATYITVLENLMAEVKPEVGRNDAIKNIIESIRDANIKITSELQGDQRLHTMKRFVSPSETAGKIVPKKKK